MDIAQDPIGPMYLSLHKVYVTCAWQASRKLRPRRIAAAA